MQMFYSTSLLAIPLKTAPALNDSSSPSVATIALIAAAYLGVMGGVVYGLVSVREWARETYVSETEYAKWEEWREEAEKQASGEGPVRRRPPTSDTPPVLELTQEYFVQVLVVSLVLSSALFAASTYLIRGMLLSPGVIRSD